MVAEADTEDELGLGKDRSDLLIVEKGMLENRSACRLSGGAGDTGGRNRGAGAAGEFIVESVMGVQELP